MAKKARAKRKKSRVGWKVTAVLLACLLALTAGLYLLGRVVHVRYATVTLADLPASLDGMTILFVSDIDAHGGVDARAAAKLLRRLSALEPDALLLGGDFAGPGLWDVLNGRGLDDSDVAAAARETRATVLAALAEFSAPLGKFAVAAEDDYAADAVGAAAEENAALAASFGLNAAAAGESGGAGDAALKNALAAAGVRLLENEAVSLSRDGGTVVLAGLSPQEGVAALAGTLSAGSCVIAFSHSPENFVAALTAEAGGGGAWADILLAGGTHGGQMRVGERTLLTLSEHERRYLSGWRKENGVFLLTSAGVGCEGVNLRLNTRAEVHFITLRRASDATSASGEDALTW